MLLVDDHSVVRRGLRGFLELLKDFEVVGEAENGREGVAAADRLAPDVVLMDLLMPGTDGVTATRLLTERYDGVAVMAMTSYSEVGRIRGALEAGASGYLLKDAEADQVVDAIRKTHRGEQLARAFSAAGRAAGDTLTAREREVWSLLAAGLSNREIAHRLSISERTARTHVSSILDKLALRSRTQAALYAIQQGLAPAAPAP